MFIKGIYVPKIFAAKLDIVGHACNPRILETDTGRSLCETSLDNIRSLSKENVYRPLYIFMLSLILRLLRNVSFSGGLYEHVEYFKSQDKNSLGVGCNG